MLPALALVCASFTVASAEKPRVVVLSLVPSDASVQRLADTLSETVTTELGRAGTLDAVGSNDLTALLGLERQKQLMGCSDESAQCLAEISAALGAPWLVSGALQRVGKALRVDLKLIRTRDGKAMYRDGRTVRDESELFEVVSELARSLAASPSLAPSQPTGAPPAEASTSGPSPRIAPWLLVGAGAVAVIAGAVFSVQAAGQWGQLHDPAWKAQHFWPDIESTGGAYSRNLALGISLLGAGVLLAAGGLAWWRLGPGDDSPQVAIAPSAGGVAFGGRW